MQHSPLLDKIKQEIHQVEVSIAYREAALPPFNPASTPCPWTVHSANKIIIALLDIVSDLDTRLKAAEEKLQAKEAQKPLEGSSASKQLRSIIASL